MPWTRVATVDQCPPGSATEWVAAGRIVALFRLDNEHWSALDGICPHQGGPLGKGRLEGCWVTCPWHGWQYDVGSGQHRTSPLKQPTLPVKVEDGEVYVDIEPC